MGQTWNNRAPVRVSHSVGVTLFLGKEKFLYFPVTYYCHQEFGFLLEGKYEKIDT